MPGVFTADANVHYFRIIRWLEKKIGKEKSKLRTHVKSYTIQNTKINILINLVEK